LSSDFIAFFTFKRRGDEFSEQTKYFEIRIDFVLNKFETISYKNIDIENVWEYNVGIKFIV